MAKAKAAWGIEIGHAAVKAVRLEREGSDVRVADFVVIPHPKVLTSPDVNAEDMLRMSLGQLMSQRPMEGSTVVVSVPDLDAPSGLCLCHCGSAGSLRRESSVQSG
ncbi:MAG: hypothetical protein ACKOFI_00680, partial [Phycisphaerales bacterium]